MIKPNKNSQLAVLIQKDLDRVLTDAEFSKLEEILRTDKTSLDYYVNTILAISVLNEPSASVLTEMETLKQKQEVEDLIKWEALARYEKKAEPLSLEDSERDVSPIVNLDTANIAKSTPRSKLSLFTAIISTAALILLLAYIHFIPRDIPQLVARLTYSSEAKWADVTGHLSEGCDLYAGPMQLVSGSSEITLDDGAQIFLEAPVEILLESPSQVFLRRGKLSVEAPKHARGFIVRTPSATVVDYGTEFGVIVRDSGEIETHVFKGEVELRIGSDPLLFDRSKKLTAGYVGRVASEGDLSFDKNRAQPVLFGRFAKPEKGYLTESSITVENHSFEEPLISYEDNTVSFETVPYWYGSNQSGSDPGITRCYKDGSNGTPSDGRNVATIGYKQAINQLLNYEIASGETYTLTIDTKLSLDVSSSRTTTAMLIFYYVDSNSEPVELASNTVRLDNRKVWTLDHTLNFISDTGKNDYVGKKLGIEIRNTGDFDTWVHVDNVRVSVIGSRWNLNLKNM